MNPALRLARHELRMLRSLVLAVRRRQDGVGPHDVAVPYARGGRPTGLLFLALAAAELVAVELLVPWPGARRVLLVLGVWTLLYVVLLLAAQVAHPHVVRPDALLVRQGVHLAVEVPWSEVGHVESRVRRTESAMGVTDGRLHLPTNGETTLDVALRRPLPVRLPLDRTTHRVTALSLSADDPRLLREATAAAIAAAG